MRLLKDKSRAGFSFIELLVVMGIIAIMAGVALVNLVGRRSATELNTTAQKIAALLREAQSRSVVQASSSAWGVHFDNRTSPGFYSLFSATYSTSSRENVYPLSTNLRFSTSTVASGSVAEVTFAQISGRSSGSTTIGIYMVGAQNSSTTITIGTSGDIFY